MLNRQLREFGLPPVWGYLLGLAAFFSLSYYLFYRTAYAEWLYPFACLFYLARLSEKQRATFLRSCFSDIDYRKVRLLENTIVAAPFLAFLLYQGSWEAAAGLLAVAALLAVVHFGNPLPYSMPTPFSRRPFEFTVGFRKTYALCFLAFFLAIMAISVENFGLGVFSLILIFLNGMYYYYEPEAEYYVWIFSAGPRAFLWSKIKTALWYSTLLSLPVFLPLIVAFPHKGMILAGVMGIGYLYLLTILLAKYSVFPGRMTLPQELLIAFGVWFPPILLGLIPYFYSQSLKKLNRTLA